MSGVATAIVASAVVGYSASSKAASAQKEASAQSNDAQERIADKQIAAQKEATDRQIELQEPWRQAGVGALNKLVPLSEYTKFGMDQFQQDPGYAFRLSEGQKALDRSAAARGGLISGSALKAATRYGQDMGSEEYTNAFNRYQTERASQLQPLQALAGIGQSATNQMGNAAGAYGSNTSAVLGALGAAQGANAINAGNARASAYVGGANAMTQGLNSYLNYNQNQNMMNMLAQNQNRGQYTPGSSSFVGPMPQ